MNTKQQLALALRIIDAYEQDEGYVPHCVSKDLEQLRAHPSTLELECEVLRSKLDLARSALQRIARPKVGPESDWRERETNAWRACWYAKYQDIARQALKDIG